jgi:uncharacterized protein (DUF2336 family)
MSGLACEFLRFASAATRTRVAERLAKAADPPPDLLNALALDDIDVARSILLDSTAITDQALGHVIRHGSGAHRCAIAARQGLSKDLSAQLAAQEDLAAAQVLVANSSADISGHTMNELATMSQNSPGLAQSMLARKDLPAVIAHRMFWWLSGAARRFVIEKHSIDINELENTLSEAGRQGVIRAPDHMAVKRLVDTVSIHSRMPVSGLIEVMRQGSLERFTWALCERLSIEFKTGKKIVSDPGGEALAVACRALRADKGQFINLFLLVDFKRSKRARPVSDLTEISQVYDRVSHHRATASVALWDTLERG